MNLELYAEMQAAAKAAFPQEACGLIASTGVTQRLILARNLSEDPERTFDLDPEAWLKVRDDEEVVGIFHSHPKGTAKPSPADLSMIEATNLPWHIVGLVGDDYRVVNPSGYQAPYEGREYVWRIHDCYSLVRDWYKREWGLHLPDFDRDPFFWEKGQSLYEDNYANCGFVKLIDQPLQVGDLLLIQVMSKVPNHGAIYVGNGEIIHHVHNRLSKRDRWGGMWARGMSHHLRHESRMGASNANG